MCIVTPFLSFIESVQVKRCSPWCGEGQQTCVGHTPSLSFLPISDIGEYNEALENSTTQCTRFYSVTGQKCIERLLSHVTFTVRVSVHN